MSDKMGIWIFFFLFFTKNVTLNKLIISMLIASKKCVCMCVCVCVRLCMCAGVCVCVCVCVCV